MSQSKPSNSNIPLSRQQAVDIVNEIYNHLTCIANCEPNALRASKDRLLQTITGAPLPLQGQVYVDGGNRTWDELGKIQEAQRLREGGVPEFNLDAATNS